MVISRRAGAVFATVFTGLADLTGFAGADATALADLEGLVFGAGLDAAGLDLAFLFLDKFIVVLCGLYFLW